MELSKDDLSWIKKAAESDFTRLQIVKMLEKAQYPRERVDAFLEEVERIREKDIITPKSTEVTEEEVEWKSKVKTFFDHKANLTWNERRKVKKFLNNVKAYSKMISKAITGIEREMNHIKESSFSEDKVIKELEDLRQEVIDRLIDSKKILDIEHPISKEVISKENMQDLSIDVLIAMMKENLTELEQVIQGKII